MEHAFSWGGVFILKKLSKEFIAFFAGYWLLKNLNRVFFVLASYSSWFMQSVVK